MSELAVNQHGETFAVPQEVTHWMVRRMSDVPRGGPAATFTPEGRPIVIAVDTTLVQFHTILRQHGCAPGKYRLDPLDAAGRPVKGGTPAYLPFPPGRREPAVREEPAVSERPRNGNAVPMPYAMPAAGWSTGGAFPIPVPMQMTASEYLLAEQIRAGVELERIREQGRTAREEAQGNAVAILADKCAAMMGAAAEIVRAADGASLPKRRPQTEREMPRPQVFVQPVPTPIAYDDDDLEDDDGAEDAPPAPTSVWTDKLGGVVDELGPLVKMMIQSKLADVMSGGGGGLSGLDALLGGMMPGGANATAAAPRNAAPVGQAAPEPASVSAPAIDHTVEALEHLGCVIERLNRERAGQALRDELRHMSPDARIAFAMELLPYDLEEACEEAVGKVVAIRVRRSRAMIAAERARGEVVSREYEGRDLVSCEPESAPPAARDGAPADADDAPAAMAAPTTGDEFLETSEEPADAIPTPGYDHVRTTTGPNGHRLSLYRPRAAVPATPAVSDTHAAASPAPVPSPAAMARLVEILPHLAPPERAMAQKIAASLPADKRALLLDKLVSVALPEAIGIVKEILATHAAHGSPIR